MTLSRHDLLHRLDDALSGVRQMMQHRWYRKNLMVGLSHDVELATLRLLRSLQRAGDSCSVGEIAESLAIAPSTASRLGERAVKSGYVERLPGTSDRRRVRLQLTPAGHDLLEEVNIRRRDILAEVTHDWMDEDLRWLGDLLALLLDDFRRVEGSE